MYGWVNIIYGRFLHIFTISWQKHGRSRYYALLSSNDFKVIYYAHYHKQNCTLRDSVQFVALFMHNPDDKNPPRDSNRLKHTTTLFSLSDHYIVSRELRVIAEQVQINYHGRPNGTIISQVWSSCWLWGILIMVGCVLSQLKPSELYILSCGKGHGLRPRPFLQLRM